MKSLVHFGAHIFSDELLHRQSSIGGDGNVGNGIQSNCAVESTSNCQNIDKGCCDMVVEPVQEIKEMEKKINMLKK